MQRLERGRKCIEMLDSVFNMDNPLFRFMNRIADMVVLNVICSLSEVPFLVVIRITPLDAREP